MQKSTSVTLGDYLSRFVERQVNEGSYGSASEVLRAGLRMLEQEELRLAALRAALIEGDESGVSEKTVEDIWAEVAAGSAEPFDD